MFGLGSSSNRPKAEQCELCRKPFTLFNKQHQCKRCFRAVCHDCARDQALIARYDKQVQHRICHVCRDEQVFFHEFKLRNQLTFCRNSPIATKWMTCIKDKFLSMLNEAEIESTYDSLLKTVRQQPNDEIKAVIQQYLISTYKQTKEQMNFSFYDWHHLMTSKENETFIQSKITNVLTAFYSSNPVQMTSNLILMILFFLYFASEAFTYEILSYLHTYLIPSEYQYYNTSTQKDQDKVIPSEIDFLMEMLRSNKLMDQTHYDVTQQFLEKNTTSFLSSLFLNKLNFPCSFLVIDKLFQVKEFVECEKYLVILCKLGYRYMIKKDFNNLLIKSVNQKKLKEIKITDERAERGRGLSRQMQHSITSFDSSEGIYNPRYSMSLPNNEDTDLLEGLAEVLMEQPQSKIKKVLDNVRSQKQNELLRGIIDVINQKNEKIKKLKSKVAEQQRVIEKKEEDAQEQAQVDALHKEMSKLKNENSSLNMQLTSVSSIPMRKHQRQATYQPQQLDNLIENQKMMTKMKSLYDSNSTLTKELITIKKDYDHLKAEMNQLHLKHSQQMHLIQEQQLYITKLQSEDYKFQKEELYEKEKELYELKFNQIPLQQELIELRKIKQQNTFKNTGNQSSPQVEQGQEIIENNINVQLQENQQASECFIF